MRNFILAAFAAVSLTAGIIPLAHAATMDSAQTTNHAAPSGNTGGQFVGGGDGG